MINHNFNSHTYPSTLASSNLGDNFKEFLKSKAKSLTPIAAGGLAAPVLGVFSLQLLKNYSKPLCIVVADQQQAQLLKQQISFFDQASEVYIFPELDILPFDDSQADPRLVGQRLQTLLNLSQKKKAIYIFSVSSITDKTISVKDLSTAALYWHVDQSYDRQALSQQLTNLGYVAVDQVQECGEYCMRGDKLDVFSAAHEHPLRIIFDYDKMVKIRLFDIDSQLSIPKINLSQATILSVSEVIFSQENIQRAQQQLQTMSIVDYEQYNKTLRQIAGGFYSGARRYLAAYQQAADLADYIDQDCLLLLYEPDFLLERYKFIKQEIEQEFTISQSQGWITLDIPKMFNDWSDVISKIRPSLTFTATAQWLENKFNFKTATNSIFLEKSNKKEGFSKRLLDKITHLHDLKIPVILTASTKTNIERWRSLLHSQELDCVVMSDSAQVLNLFVNPQWFASILIIPKALPQGFRWVDEHYETRGLVLSDQEIFIDKGSRRKKKSSAINLLDFNSLQIGDYVVHEDYGIAIFDGLLSIDHQGIAHECMKLSFKGKDKVFVPLEHFHLVQKYASADSLKPVVSKLGTSTWQQTKAKVKKEVERLAKDLVALYAKRQTFEGSAFTAGERELEDFRRDFPYEETEDQLQAIEETLQDLSDAKPMDRLICGDVGFGKTEVAMRAVLKVVACGYQSVIIAPTTILAEQHYLNFKKRFAKFNYRIAMVSRFQSAADIKEAIKQLATGKIDIAIGTHRLLSNDINFKQLGLIVIDEEHRFGVRQKEKLRLKYSLIDCLSLSATPIPRTLQMSLSGISDISLINTPPVNRHKIKTRVLRFDKQLIKEAVSREIRRGGQVFFIHNRVENIMQIYSQLQTILPNVKINVAHGQLPKHLLEEVMQQFVQNKFSVLLATSIIEAGLDIPNANTIIVNNAHKLGLAQLYQMRGRVGRSSKQAYAYYLLAEDTSPSLDAERRLQALQEFSELGSGYKLASHDLAIRGAGNFFGEDQSGNISLVGIEHFLRLLKQAVDSLQSGVDPNINQESGVNTIISNNVTSHLPNNYINSQQQRLSIYRQFAACKSEDEVWQLRNNIEDRFGDLPLPAKNLVESVLVKIWAQKLTAELLEIKNTGFTIQLSANLKPDINKLLSFIQQNSGQLLPPQKIYFKIENCDALAVIEVLKNFYSSVIY